MTDNQDDQIREILLSSHTIAIVGLSPKPVRPSHRVAEKMQSYGFQIIPVRPAVKEILGQKVYRSLLDIEFPVDIVDVFRAEQHIPELVEQTIQVGARCLWLQEGIQHPSTRLAQESGMPVFKDRCILKDYMRLCVEEDA